MHAFAKIAVLSATLLVLAGAPALAAEPAVSGPNGKFSVEGGGSADEGEGVATGSFALPIGHDFGIQADGSIGSFDDELLGGLAVHLFARDPSRYLFGVYGSYHTWDRINIWRTALEGELYIGPVTLEGLAGYESLDVPSFIDGRVVSLDDNHLFGQADAAYYFTDDFRVYAGYRYINERSFGAAGTEYLIRGLEVPVALFARGDFGDEFVQNVTGGVRVYLSDDPYKTLIDRHRKDDPKVYAPTFPTLAPQTTAQKSTPQCVMSGNQVASPAGGDCICPSGTWTPGQKPTQAGGGGGGSSAPYYCGGL
jgi:hypothetical protein